MNPNQAPENQEQTKPKSKNRRQRLIKWGAGTTAALTLAAGGVGYAATRGDSTHSRTPAAAKHESKGSNQSETYSTYIEAYNAFAKDLIDGKIPVRVLGATVTFSLNGQKDKYGLSADKLLAAPFPDSYVYKGETPEHPLYFAGSMLGVANFQGRDYLYGCNITDREADHINPSDASAGCLQRKWGDGGENYMLFIDLGDPPADLKIFTNGSTLKGQVSPGQLQEPGSDSERKLIGPNYTEGHGFEVTYSPDPSQNNFIAENYQEIPISTVIGQIG